MMETDSIREIVVIGAGVIGLAAAVSLQRAGYSVLLLDEGKPSEGCSAGNAGVIAVSEIFPIINARRALSMPWLLLNPTGPLTVKPTDLPDYLPWFLRGSQMILPQAQKRSIAAISSLNRVSLDAWQDLLSHCEARNLLVENGMIEILPHAPNARRVAAYRDLLGSHNVPSQLLTTPMIFDLEPELRGDARCGLFYSGAAHVSDPLLIGRTLFKVFLAKGGTFQNVSVRQIHPRPDHVTIFTDQGSIQARQILVSAGLASKTLLDPLGFNLPIRPERGYHLMLPKEEGRLIRPVAFQREAFIATPMTGGLRLAGTVELAKASAKPNWRRSTQLRGLASRYLGPLRDEQSACWMGSRPSFPDSLPAIGRLRTAPRIAYAFGHQHLGLTQAAITARHIVDIIGGKTVPTSVGVFDIERFGRMRE
jgi:D-hydroxyproline dehydrogenase